MKLYTLKDLIRKTNESKKTGTRLSVPVKVNEYIEEHLLRFRFVPQVMGFGELKIRTEKKLYK